MDVLCRLEFVYHEQLLETGSSPEVEYIFISSRKGWIIRRNYIY